MRKIWTDTDLQKLKAEYPHRQTKDIAADMQRSEVSIYGAASVHGLKKSEEFFKSELSGRIAKGKGLGKEFRFQKGQTAFNKGKKWQDFMSKEAQQRSRKTTFQKGNLPHNTKERNGAISIRFDAEAGRHHQWIRVKLGKWVELHRYVWKKKHGRIPKGMCVAFKDRDTMNCTIENLELITRKENMERNTIHRYPAEMKDAIRTLGRLKSKITQYEKQDNRPAQSPV